MSEDIKSTIDEASVVNYLEKNPEFFSHHESLLAAMVLPHECGTATSLLEKQANILRQERRSLKTRLDQIIETSRDNQHHYEQLHKMMLLLIEKNTLTDVFEGIAKGLFTDFKIDRSLFYLRSSLFVDIASQQTDNFSLMMLDEVDIDDLQTSGPELNGATCCIIDDTDVREGINTRQDLQLASCVWVSLDYAGKSLGVLILGSAEKDRFHVELDTFFVSNFAECLSCKLNELI